MWIGHQLLSLHSLPGPAIALCVSIIIAVVTEVMSNVATTTLFLPVLAQLVRLALAAISHLALSKIISPAGSGAGYQPSLFHDLSHSVSLLCLHAPSGHST